MEQTVEQKQELTVIDKSIEVFKGGSAILVKHKNRASKALAVGRSIIQQWSDAYAIQDPAARFEALAVCDARSNKFLANCRDANTEMKEMRAAITQLMDAVKSMFTEEENSLDVKQGPVPKEIQAKRNVYVTDLAQEQERLRKAAEALAAKQKETVDLRAHIRNAIGQALVKYQAERKSAWMASFNGISLSTYDEKAEKLKGVNTAFPASKRSDLIQISLPYTRVLGEAEKLTIQTEEFEGYDFQTFYLQYGTEMASLKKELQDKLPSKLAELQEAKRLADKAEEDRLAELQRQKEAEALRQKKMREAADQAEKDRLQKQAEKDRQAEKERLLKIEEDNEKERLRQEKEKQDRERDEAQRLKDQELAAQQKVISSVELGRTAGHAQSLFSLAEATAEAGPAPSTRQGYEIEVLTSAGWVELFTFWFQREGVSTPVDAFGKKTLESMRKFAQDVAQKAEKDGKTDKIESKHLIYKAITKAVNVKEKKGGANG